MDAIQNNDVEELDFKSIIKLSDDIKKASLTLGREESKFLVNSYYSMQDQRIRSGNRIKAMSDGSQPHEVVDWIHKNFKSLESRIQHVLGEYAKGFPLGVWSQSNPGIGPVLSAALLAYIDEKKPTCGHIMSYAGMIEGVVWMSKNDAKKTVASVLKTLGIKDKGVTHEQFVELSKGIGACPKWISRRVYRSINEDPINFKGWDSMSDLEYVKAMLPGIKPKISFILDVLSKMPWNADLKNILWKAGSCFVKTCNNEKSLYGRVYAFKKALEIEKNENLAFKDQAEKKLEKYNIGKSTEAYKHYSQGKLPPAHIMARSQRYAVKLFVSHYHAVGYFCSMGELPPKPWPIEHGGHAHVIEPPNMEIIPGLEKAWRDKYGDTSSKFIQV